MLVIGVGNTPADIAPPIGSDAIAMLIAIADLFAVDLAAREIHDRQNGGADHQEGVRLHDLTHRCGFVTGVGQHGAAPAAASAFHLH